MERAQQAAVYVKLLMIGDSDTGKSCLLQRFADGRFYRDMTHTIGIDFKTKYMDVGTGLTAKVQIWDTAGQERFRSITTSYFAGAMGLVLCYDVTNRRSFENVQYWMSKVAKMADLGVDVILVGNKIDLRDGAQQAAPESSEAVIPTAEGRALADSYDPPIKFFETSAKTGHEVAGVFETLVIDVVERLQREHRASPHRVASQINLALPEAPRSCFRQKCC